MSSSSSRRPVRPPSALSPSLRRLVAAALGWASFVASPDASAQAAHVDPIIRGNPVPGSGQHATVALVGAFDLRLVCTGTLVRRRVVVTAAHCFFDRDGVEHEANELAVVAGLPVLPETIPLANVYPVVGGGPNPGYPASTSQERQNGLNPDGHDIGVLLLSRDVTQLTPVSITTRSRTSAVTEIGSTVTLEGYGVTAADSDTVGALMGVPSSVLARIANELLIGPQQSSQGDTCFGDSGGPVYAEVDGVTTLVAVTSRGRPDVASECGEGGVYTNVAFHREFLAEASGDASLGPVDDGGCSVSGPSTRRTEPLLSIPAILVATRLARRRGRRRLLTDS